MWLCFRLVSSRVTGRAATIKLPGHALAPFRTQRILSALSQFLRERRSLCPQPVFHTHVPVICSCPRLSVLTAAYKPCHRLRRAEDSRFTRKYRRPQRVPEVSSAAPVPETGEKRSKKTMEQNKREFTRLFCRFLRRSRFFNGRRSLFSGRSRLLCC